MSDMEWITKHMTFKEFSNLSDEELVDKFFEYMDSWNKDLTCEGCQQSFVLWAEYFNDRYKVKHGT